MYVLSECGATDFLKLFICERVGQAEEAVRSYCARPIIKPVKQFRKPVTNSRQNISTF